MRTHGFPQAIPAWPLRIGVQRWGAAPADHPLLDGLVAYYDLGEASGNRADSSGNGRTLTDNNTVGSGAGIGGVGTAAEFVRANNETLSLAHAAPFVLDSNFTACVWAYLSATDVNQALFSKGAPFSAGGEWSIHFQNGQSFQWRIRNADNSGFVSTSLAGSLSATTWYFVAVRYNAGTEATSISIDAGTPTTGSISGGPYTGGSNPLRLGGDGGNYLGGRLQYAGLWRRELSDAHLTWLYNSGAGRNYAAVAAYTG